MPRLEDQLKISVISEPEPEPAAVVLAGGSDLPEGKQMPPAPPTEKPRDPVIDNLMKDMPMEDDDVSLDEPDFVLKPPPKSEDLFEAMSPTTKRARSPLSEEAPQKPVKLTKTGRVKREKGMNKDGSKRKPMSEEHKQKLAQARAKAHAKRRAMGAKSRDIKSKERAKKDLEILAKEKDLDDELNVLKEKVGAPEKVVKEAVKEVVAAKQDKKGITKEDLEEISLKTVIAIETMRKQRKAEKKKKQQEEQYKAEVMNTIRQAKPSWISTAGQYADCF